MKITYFRLKGYVRILNGMGLDELIIPFGEFKNRITLISGENGTGKSTIIDALSPNPDSSDSFRTDVFIDSLGNRQIIEYPGEKEIWYEEIDEFGTRNEYKILIQSLVNDSRTVRTTKAFISKNGEEYNPNGNVTSFKEMRDTLLGIDPIYLDLSSITSEHRGIVDMVPSERRKYMAAYIGSLDTFNNIYKVLSKKSSSLKTYMNAINSKLYELGDENELRLKQIQLETNLKDLNNKRDSLLKQLAESEATIHLMDADGKILTIYTSITDELKQINYDLDKNNKKSALLYSDLESEPSIISNGIDSAIEEKEILINKNKSTIDENNSRISTIVALSKTKSETLEEDKARLLSLASTQTRDNIEKLISDVKYTIKMYEEYLSQSQIDMFGLVGRNELIGLRESLLEFISNINTIESEHSADEFEIGIMNSNKAGIDELNQDIDHDNASIEEYNNDIITEKSNLAKLYSDLNIVTSSKRPTECRIDTCPYIKDIVSMPSEDELRSKINEKENHIKRITEIRDTIKKHMVESKAYVEVANSCMLQLSILMSKSGLMKKINAPDYYYNEELLINKLRNHNRLDSKWIDEIISNYTEYENYIGVLNQLDPLDAEYESYMNNKSLIESLNKSISKNESDIQDLENELKDKSNENEFLSGINDSAERILSKLKEIKSINEELALLNEKKENLRIKFNEVKDQIKTVKDKMDDINSIKEDLEKTEESITPLNDAINNIKYNLSNIVQYQQELQESSDKFDKITFIKNACSPGNGMGIQSEYIKRYMNDIIIECNSMLGYMFNEQIKLDVPVINEKQFSLPFMGPGGLIVPDISGGSTAQKCMIGLVFSCVAMMKSSLKYNIPRFDEIDGGLDQGNRIRFIGVLNQVLDFMHSEQCVICSHNVEFDTQSTTRIICSPRGIKIEE